MEFEIEKLIKLIESKSKLISALSMVKLDNKIFVKSNQREKGKSYASSEEMLASLQTPFNEHGIHVQMLASSLKDASVVCAFAATHLESGETLIYTHAASATSATGTIAPDSVEAAKTRCIGTFARGITMVPKLSPSQMQHTKETIDYQKKISQANEQIKHRILEQASEG